MKKVLIVLVLMMTALIVNAQSKSGMTQAKSAPMVVKVADLPKAISDNIAKDYPGFTIKEATCTNENNMMTYKVHVVNGMNKETLLYDKDGKLLKKVDKEMMKPEPKKK